LEAYYTWVFCIRLDILYTISKAAQNLKDPNMEDWENLLRILKYLKGTIKYGINISRYTYIKAFVDTDYGGVKKMTFSL